MGAQRPDHRQAQALVGDVAVRSALENGKADDGNELLVPVTTYYSERALREEAVSRANGTQWRLEQLEKRYQALLELVVAQYGDSPLARRCALQLELAGMRKPSNT